MPNSVSKRINQVRLGDYILINNKVCECTKINTHITHPQSGRRSFIELSGYDIFNHHTHKERFPGRGQKFILCPNVSTRKYIVCDIIVKEQKYYFTCVDVNSFDEKEFIFSFIVEPPNIYKEIIDKLNYGVKQILIKIMITDGDISLISYKEID